MLPSRVRRFAEGAYAICPRGYCLKQTLHTLHTYFGGGREMRSIAEEQSCQSGWLPAKRSARLGWSARFVGPPRPGQASALCLQASPRTPASWHRGSKPERQRKPDHLIDYQAAQGARPESKLLHRRHLRG
jgi:hypothetical protein